MLNIFLSNVKNNYHHLKKHLFGHSYRFVIWSELTREHQLHLEIVSINYTFERNKTVLGIHYDCVLDENEILRSLLEIKNKYKIIELIETNYKFQNPLILSKFIITKSNELLFQNSKKSNPE